MLIIKRYLSLLFGIITFIFLEVFICFPSQKIIFIFLPYCALLICGLWYLQNGKLQDIKQKIAYFILPILAVANFVAFLIYLDFDKIFLHLAALIFATIIWLYFESFFLKYYFIKFYKFHSFENMAEELIIIASFLFFVNFFGSKIYIDWAPYRLFIIAGVILFLLLFMQFAFNNFLIKQNFLVYLAVVPFLSLELLFASTFLPTNFYSLAMINTLFFYLFMIFSRHHLLEKCSAKMARRYLSLSAILLIFIIIISRWT